jgi:nucleotide-binding universal stress UspA family protein
MSFARILVATDFGDASMEALHAAFKLANKLGSKVELLHVYRAQQGGHASALAALHALAELYADSPAFDRSTALEGDPAKAIVDYAIECHADLLVIGVNGGLGGKSELVGGTAESVLRNARCPVVVTRPSELSMLSNAEARLHRQP